MIDPLYAYTISFLILIIIVFLKKNVLYAVSIGTVIFGILSLKIEDILKYTLLGIFNYTTYRLFASIILALYLASVLGDVGVLEKLTRGVSALGYKTASVSVPALIGLIPMPGGALVSAIMVKNLYFNTLKIKKEIGAFLNYWFRHIWVPSWPLYQSVILAAAILHISIIQLLSITYPASLAGIVTGGIMAYFLLKGKEGREEGESKELIIHLWPFILIFILGLVLRLDIIITLGTTLLAVILCYKPNIDLHKKAIKFALTPKIMGILLFAMIYREYVIVSGASEKIFEILAEYNVNPYIVVYMVPFLIGAATSSEIMFTVLAFPPLMNIFFPVKGVIDQFSLLIGYTGGWLGVMFSPVHLCLVLTVEHFKADLRLTYKYIIPVIIATTAVVGLFYILI